MPLLAPLPHEQGLDRVRRMKKNAASDENHIWGARLGGIFCAGAPKWRLGGL
jgi:hypothetical protein